MSGSPPAVLDSSSRKSFFAAIAILSLYVAWSIVDLKKPWIGAHDWNGAAWSTAARHLIERPISETRLGVSLDHGSAPLDPNAFYVHHPPLVVWLLAGAYKVFGATEQVGRLVPLLFTGFGAVCLAGIGAIGGGRGSIFGLAIFLATPGQLFYGRMPNHEPIALPLMLAASYAALLWTLRPTTRRLFFCLLAVALACLSSWAAFFFAAALGLSALRWHPIGRTLFLGVAATSAAVLVFLLWHMRFVRADAWTDLLAAFFLRSGNVDAGAWLTTIGDWLCRMLTPIGAAAVLLFTARILRLPTAAERVLLPLLVAGWANVLVFRQGSFVHEYYTYFLTAPAALICGLTLAKEGTKAVAFLVVGAVLLAGLPVAAELRARQSQLYASDVSESPRFIVELGRKIAEAFPPDAKILVDVAPIGEHLAFYADRRMIYLQKAMAADLPRLVADADGVVGNARLPAPRELLDRVVALAGGRVVERREFAVEGHGFLAVRFARRN